MCKSHFLLVVVFALVMAFTFACGTHTFEETLGLLGSSSSSSGTVGKDGSSSSSSETVGEGGSSSSWIASNLGPCVDGLVTIDKQVWKKCNSNIEPGKDGESKCYGNDPANCARYGRLYNWEAAKSACEPGFHLPSKGEWDALIVFVEKDKSCIGTCAAKYLKAINGWNSKDDNSLDPYGFSALPGGLGFSEGSFSGAGDNGLWWTASECGGGNGTYSMGIREDYSNGCQVRNYLFSVRCLKD